MSDMGSTLIIHSWWAPMHNDPNFQIILGPVEVALDNGRVHRFVMSDYVPNWAFPINRYKSWIVDIPYWWAVVGFGILPSRAILRWIYGKLWKKKVAGICAVCGYDLRYTESVSGMRD